MVHKKLTVSQLALVFGLSNLLLKCFQVLNFIYFSTFFWYSYSINIEAKEVQLPNILFQLTSLSIPTSDPTSRPTFQELLERLKELQKRYAIQFQAARSSAGGESAQKES